MKPIIQQHVCAAFDVPGTTEAIKNTLDWNRAHALGIQMVGMNFFTEAGNLQGYRDTFGLYSFKLKPEAMRYAVKIGKNAKKAGPETDMKSGTVTMPNLDLRS